jgi:hypothetical protein
MSDEDTPMRSWNREVGLSSQTRRGILKKSGAAVAGVTAVTGTAAADGDPPTTSGGVEISFTPENRIDGPTAQASLDTERLDYKGKWGTHEATINCDGCDKPVLKYSCQTGVYRSKRR